MSAQRKDGYNGWSNRATWNVNLWLSNDEGTYRHLNSRARRYTDPDPEDNDVDGFAKEIRDYCREVWPTNETPDGDALADCDFEEVAAAWLEE